MSSTPRDPSPPLTRDDHATCAQCGCVGAYRFDGETLCAECYAQRGSCCAEGGCERESEAGEKQAAAERKDFSSR